MLCSMIWQSHGSQTMNIRLQECWSILYHMLLHAGRTTGKKRQLEEDGRVEQAPVALQERTTTPAKRQHIAQGNKQAAASHQLPATPASQGASCC